MSQQQRPSAQYQITIRLDYPHEPGWVAQIAAAIAEQRGSLRGIVLIEIDRGRTTRDYSIECPSTERAERLQPRGGRAGGRSGGRGRAPDGCIPAASRRDAGSLG